MAKYLIKFTLNGTPKTALTPAVDTYIKLSDSTDVAQVPTIAEAKNGFYIMTATPSEPMGVRIDGGAGITNAAERYKFLQIGPNDYFADASISSRASATDYTSTRAGKLDNLDGTISGIPAAVWSAGTRTLTSFGTLVASIWANSVRSLTTALTDEAEPKDMAAAGGGDAPTVEDIDTRLSSTHGSGPWGAGTSGSYSRTVTITNGSNVAIPDVSVSVLNLAGTPIQGPFRTNAQGMATFHLDAGSYLIRCVKAFVNFSGDTALTVAANGNTAITGSTFTPAPPALGYQTLYGNAYHASSTAAQGDVVSFVPDEGQLVSGATVNPTTKSTVVASDGTWSLQIRKGVHGVVRIRRGNAQYYQKTLTVSSDDTKDLASYA
jgi:hypothetical protein